MFALKLSVFALILCLLVISTSSEKFDGSSKSLDPTKDAESEPSLLENAERIYMGEEQGRNKRMAKIKIPKPSLPKPKSPRPTLPSGHSYHTPPKTSEMKGFPQAIPQKPIDGRKTWKDEDSGKILQWDRQHGELEAYGKNKKHEGSYDHQTGEKLKPAVPGRKLED